ncbi:DUF937 domain-containing protein [Aeoliella sp. ICT_H6.2]|uniref:DUF937 domain-containing protein n=1 Tax=Aeoliella straminimaris TaxID=2954799 RepID=A0A9X2JFW9_9BACT|nr:DUF937 domain-containing protein [Aeoliella straminimaris]MCO6042853.1 DUF937 domain-containing protein [Aeoliella straminimaris]
MSTIIDAFAKQLSSEDVSSISQQLGVNDATTKKAIGAAIPGLIAALSRASEDPQKSQRLAEAVNQHAEHTEGLLDQVGNLFKQFTQSGDQQAGGPDLGQLISDVLGGHEERVQKGVSQTSGLNSEMAGKLIKFLGPMVVGVIAKQLSGQHANAATVNGHLNQERQELEQKHGDLLGRLFDQDGDGDFDMSDMASVFVKKMAS